MNEARDGSSNNTGDSRPDSRGEGRTARRDVVETKRRLPPTTSSSESSSHETYGRTVVGSTLTKSTYSHHAGSPSTVLLQDTLTPLLDEVDVLFERSKEIVATVKAQGNGEDVRESSLCCFSLTHRLFAHLFSRSIRLDKNIGAFVLETGLVVAIALGLSS